VPAHGVVIGGSQDNVPALRSLSGTLIDHMQILEDLDLEYGSSLESVTFIDRLNFVSPFARLTYHPGSKGEFTIAFSSGAPPLDCMRMETWFRSFRRVARCSTSATSSGRDSCRTFRRDWATISALP